MKYSNDLYAKRWLLFRFPVNLIFSHFKLLFQLINVFFFNSIEEQQKKGCPTDNSVEAILVLKMKMRNNLK